MERAFTGWVMTDREAVRFHRCSRSTRKTIHSHDDCLLFGADDVTVGGRRANRIRAARAEESAMRGVLRSHPMRDHGIDCGKERDIIEWLVEMPCKPGRTRPQVIGAARETGYRDHRRTSAIWV